MSRIARTSLGSTDRLIFGLHLEALTMDEVVQRCRDALTDERRMLIGVVNAAKLVNVRRDSLLRDSLLECDLIVADGQSVVWASRLVRQPLPERVAGCDLFEELLAVAEHDGRSVFLLGAKPDVLELLKNRLAERFPKLTIAGSRDGYFSTDQNSEVADQIRESGADMLFLGITSPKKEIFLGTYGDSLAVPILHGVGGSFDVVAGVTKRAPERWQRIGMEWAYRVVQEPKRMWKRYLTTNTRFVFLLGKETIHPSAPFVSNPSAPMPRSTGVESRDHSERTVTATPAQAKPAPGHTLAS